MKDNKKKKAANVKADQAAEQDVAENVDAAQPEQEDGKEITITREKLEEMNTYVKDTEIKRDEYLALAQRVQADFDNFRRRNASMRTEVMEDTLRDTVKEILPSLDNLERAIEAARSAGENEGTLLKGVEMTLRGFEEALEKLGMERVDAATGTLFDPEMHNAVMMTPADDEHAEGTIIECFQTGFAVKGKVVRYAMVRVAN